MEIMYNYLLTILATSLISFIWLSIYNRTVLVCHSNLTCTYFEPFSLFFLNTNSADYS